MKLDFFVADNAEKPHVGVFVCKSLAYFAGMAQEGSFLEAPLPEDEAHSDALQNAIFEMVQVCNKSDNAELNKALQELYSITGSERFDAPCARGKDSPAQIDVTHYQWIDEKGQRMKLPEMSRNQLLQALAKTMDYMAHVEELTQTFSDRAKDAFDNWSRGRDLPPEPNEEQ